MLVERRMVDWWSVTRSFDHGGSLSIRIATKHETEKSLHDLFLMMELIGYECKGRVRWENRGFEPLKLIEDD